MKTLAQIEPRTPISSLPFTISSSGSYYLTTNLFMASGANGITIVTNNVTLDLKGFTLAGGAGTSNGIAVIVPCTNVTICNGTITGWGGAGISADQLANGYYNLLLTEANGGDGFDPGLHSHISHCQAADNDGQGFGGAAVGCTFEFCRAANNGDVGFSSHEKCLFVSCESVDNDWIGFNPFFDTTFVDCSAVGNSGGGMVDFFTSVVLIHFHCSDNFGVGVQLADQCVVRDSFIFRNYGDGIDMGAGCSVSGCNISENNGNGLVSSTGCMINDCTVFQNTDNGLAPGDHSRVENCTVTTNVVGILATNNCTIADCTVDGNSDSGIRVTSSCQVFNNKCSANGQGNTGNSGINCLNSFNRIDANQLTDNLGSGLLLNGSSNTVTRNSAKNNTSNYSVGSGNDVGPIGSAATSTSPWANLQ